MQKQSGTSISCSIVLLDRTTGPIARYWRNDAEREKQCISSRPSDRAHSNHRAVSWSRVGDTKVEHRHYVLIESVDTVERYVFGIGYERIDFLQSVDKRETGRPQSTYKNLNLGPLASHKDGQTSSTHHGHVMNTFVQFVRTLQTRQIQPKY
jgi:hypothetical protein